MSDDDLLVHPVRRDVWSPTFYGMGTRDFPASSTCKIYLQPSGSPFKPECLRYAGPPNTFWLLNVEIGCRSQGHAHDGIPLDHYRGIEPDEMRLAIGRVDRAILDPTYFALRECADHMRKLYFNLGDLEVVHPSIVLILTVQNRTRAQHDFDCVVHGRELQ